MAANADGDAITTRPGPSRPDEVEAVEETPAMIFPGLDMLKPRVMPDGTQRKRPPLCCIRWSAGGRFKPSYSDLGFTPLHIAIVNRAPRMMLSILAKSGYVNVKSKDGLTPLHLAVILTPDYFTVMTLIKSGAHLSIMDDLQRTPLHFAAYLNHFDAVDAILAGSLGSYEAINPWWVFNYTQPKTLDRTNLVFPRSLYKNEITKDSECKLLHQCNFDAHNRSDRAFAVLGQAHTALHFAAASVMHRICLDCLPEWRPKDHSHAYTVGDPNGQERTEVQKAHEGDVITRMMYAMLANSRKMFVYNSQWARIDQCSPEQQDYVAFFSNLPDTDDKNAMDHIVFDQNLTVEQKLKLLTKLSDWGGRFTTWKKSTISKRDSDIDAKIHGKTVEPEVVEFLRQEPPAWQRDLSFEIMSPNDHDQKDPPDSPKRSPIEATKELFEDAAIYGLQDAIILSRDPLERTSLSKTAKEVVQSSTNFEISHAMITIK
jgi:hypothetical protein